MGAQRFRFSDDDERQRPPPKVWITRAVIVGVLVGLGGAAQIILGFRWHI